jgi:hypothetical protein
VLGEKECNIIKASDKSTYTIKSSIYSYPNNINICKCQAGYEFSPLETGITHSAVDVFLLSFDITHWNSFPAKSNDTVKEFSCLPFLDNSSPEIKGLNSYPAWHLQILILFGYE